MPLTKTAHKKKGMDAYISGFPKKIQNPLQKIRRAIHTVAPQAQETISYGIPTFDTHGVHLVHFAAYANHIGFYPTPSGIAAFKRELSSYTWAKGSVQFPLDKPMPLRLIKRIVAFRVKEIRAK